MDELYSKDIRVFAGALDLKNHTSKNLIEMLNQLQTGSILNGRVVGETPKGETIFYTVYGRLITSSSQRLSNGDKIVLKIAQNKKMQGAIISVNDKTIKNPKTFDLSVLNLVNNNSNKHDIDASTVSLKAPDNILKVINGQITYLNLSQIAKDSILYKELIQVTEKTGANISFNVKSDSENISSGLFIEAEVTSNELNGAQLLKTKFGIINIENSQLPIGKKLKLEIVSLNNRQLGIDVTKNISEFILNINQSWPELQKLVDLSQEYIKIKELLVPNVANGESNNIPPPKDEWQTIVVPFFYGDIIEEKEIKINRVAEHYLRFIFDINLEKIGALQLDGLIKFKENSKTPVNFDIILRSNQKFDSTFENELMKLFAEGKGVSGFGGHLSFDKF